MASGPAPIGGAAETEGVIGAAVGVATTGCVNAVGVWAIWAASAGDAAAARVVSKAGVAGALTSDIGLPNGGGAEWTGLVAAVEIASALADIGAPVWLPALKFWTRSLGARVVGVWGAPMGLPLEGVVAAGGASMPGVTAAVVVAGAAESDWAPATPVGLRPVTVLEAREPDVDAGLCGAIGVGVLGVLGVLGVAGAVAVGVFAAGAAVLSESAFAGIGGPDGAVGVGVLGEVEPGAVAAMLVLGGAVGVGVLVVGVVASGDVGVVELGVVGAACGAVLGGGVAVGVFGLGELLSGSSLFSTCSCRS